MEKIQFTSLVRSLLSRAKSNRAVRAEGIKEPTFERLTDYHQIDGVKVHDAKLASLMTNVETAHKELDDYILARAEVKG